MTWINAKTQPPDKYKEVIICSDTKAVKSAMYLGDGKWNTFLQVVLWQPFPEAPDDIDLYNEIPKRRGRPKKSNEGDV